MANSTERHRKLLVRTVLVTGATMATLFGAQQLALLDNAETVGSDVAVPAPITVPTSGDVQHAAPHLTLLRNQREMVNPASVVTLQQPVVQRSSVSR